jgi:hypothetical protein
MLGLAAAAIFFPLILIGLGSGHLRSPNGWASYGQDFQRKLSIGFQLGPPIGIQKGPPRAAF